MEQTNLVVTPDGKTWDEVTRDVSYIGNMVVSCTYSGSNQTSFQGVVAWDEWRGFDRFDPAYGNTTTGFPLLNKNFAIAYDRVICLESGQYQVNVKTWVVTSAGGHATIHISKAGEAEQLVDYHNPGSLTNSAEQGSVIVEIQRGGWVRVGGRIKSLTNFLQITRI